MTERKVDYCRLQDWDMHYCRLATERSEGHHRLCHVQNHGK